jgi:general secretion pathway protein J
MMGRRQGMTLVEVMVAIAVLALVGLLSISTLSTALKSRDVLGQVDETQQSALVALDTVSRELNLAYLSPHTNPLTYYTIFKAEDGSNVDTVWFSSLSHRRKTHDAKESDQTEITIWTEDDPYNEGRYVLLHREAPRIDHEPSEDGVVEPLAYNVEEFHVRYLDPTTCEWVDEWDSTAGETQGRLPRAAQIVLVLMGPDSDSDDDDAEKEYTYATTVIFQYGKRARCSLFLGENEEGEVSGQGQTGVGTGQGGTLR